jgi:hypothetical protein
MKKNTTYKNINKNLATNSVKHDDISVKSSNLSEQSALDIKNENSASSNLKKTQFQDHTRFGDWVINGRTIDF